MSLTLLHAGTTVAEESLTGFLWNPVDGDILLWQPGPLNSLNWA
jgi:hypothetical protein